MKTKQRADQLPWLLIASLGSLALVRPIVKVIGDVFDYSVSLVATMAITAAIAVVWIGIVVKLNVKKPVLVLAASGAVYAVLSIAMAVIIQVVAPDLGDEDAKIAVLLTAGLIASTIFNIVYGAFLGLVASGMQRAIRK